MTATCRPGSRPGSDWERSARLPGSCSGTNRPIRQRAAESLPATTGFPRLSYPAPRSRRFHARIGERAHRLKVAFHRAHIQVGSAGAHAPCLAALSEPRIHQRPDVLVAAVQPKLVESVKGRARHLKRAPDPVRLRRRLLHLNFAYAPVFVGDDGIE